jgi:hypothetical protein
MKSSILMLLILIQSILICGCESGNASLSPVPIREASAYTEKTFPAIYPFRLEITSDSCNIEVYTWDREQAKLEIITKVRGAQNIEELEKRLKEFKLDATQQDNTVAVSSEYRGHAENSERAIMEYRVFIPKKSLDTFDLRLDTGNIKFYDDIKCNLNVQVNKANIDINRFEGIITLSADTGNLCIAGGKIGKGSDIKVKMGNIQIKAQYEDGANYRFQTGMGNIELDIPEESRVCVESIGTIDVNEFLYEDYSTRITLLSDMGKIAARKF